jgi:Glycosyltransferase family 87
VRSRLDGLVFGYLPCLLLGGVVANAFRPGNMADFHVIWGAARDVVAGHGGNFIYPPPIALTVVPLSQLPFAAAAAIWSGVLVVSTALTLHVLGVRDWRCYGATFLAASTLAVLGSGAISSLLALGTALTWRYRDRLPVVASVLAYVVVAKIFMWPLLFWLAATRRWRTLAVTASSCLLLGILSWAAVGFAGFASYPHKLVHTAAVYQGNGYSPMALALALHIPANGARLITAAVVLSLLASIFVVARRADGDRRSFVLAVLAALAATPIAWLHYYVLLLVPISLRQRHFGLIWCMPIAYWLCSMGSNGDLTKILLGTVITWAIAVTTLRTRSASADIPTAYQGAGYVPV